ncbi:hypothetical protein BDP27DRAFT_1364966 [Rhodocollybia butyracea]|uniref:Uncharacterized protein n=1 Tax=Rhodocollybia butyracea TaxID=206335 RepID=A0A9P5PP23_9AGAR|nr:hypothetical protein BDP27DRAFT_1364966 [Rhodocollybia butyracea]
MVNVLTNLTAIAAAATGPFFITNTAGNQAMDIATHLCAQLQPIQMFIEGNSAASQLFNLASETTKGGTQYQFQSNNCAGFSVSYPGEKTGAQALRAQTVLQPESQVFFTVTPGTPGVNSGPFNIIFESPSQGPLYLTGWNPDVSFSQTGPLTFELENIGDSRQEWLFVQLKLLLGIAG